MVKSDNRIEPVENCLKCGAPIIIDIMYNEPGSAGFEDLCTKCTWPRQSHFTEEGGTTKEKW